jgi:hypothetical protein
MTINDFRIMYLLATAGINSPLIVTSAPTSNGAFLTNYISIILDGWI